MKEIKVIVVDVDGTLTNQKKEITSDTKNSLIRAQNQGIVVILASGRSTRGLDLYARELHLDKYNGLLISYNGSCVVDYSTKEVLFNEPLTIKEIHHVLDHLKQFDVTPMIDCGEYLYVENIHGKMVDYESKSNNYILKKVEDLTTFVDFASNKILTSGEPEYLNTIFHDMKTPFQDELNCMFTAPFYVEYTAKGIDKAKALDTVLHNLGYTSEQVIAFGDGHNDISMLEFAGIGVAMGNAVDELKECSDYVTKSNENDGIAYALAKYAI